MTEAMKLNTYRYHGLLRTCTVSGTVEEKTTLAALNRIASIHRVDKHGEWGRLQVFRVTKKDGQEVQELIADYPHNRSGVDKVHILATNNSGDSRIVPISPNVSIYRNSNPSTNELILPTPRPNNVTPIKPEVIRKPHNKREDVVIIRPAALYKVKEA